TDRRGETGKIKPLTGKVFYLDLPSNKTTESLESDIKELGGTVEKFFSKEIKYLVSNKKEARYVNCLRQPSPVPSPDPGQSSSHPGSKLNKPCSRGDNLFASRGKSLVDRVVNEQERVHTSKILSNALEWGVKILYVEANIQPLRLSEKTYVYIVPNTSTAIFKVVLIKAELTGGRISKPFVKIEDSSRHYRPIYISLPNMPQFNLRSLPPCSPFLATDRDAPGKKLHPHRRVKATASEEKAQNGRRRNREKRGGGYCECCMIKYESITRVTNTLCWTKFTFCYSVYNKFYN
uniref:BRCT domain-containing protein n=1 Tax=Tetraodon nigroviridis TaxID=99883 RepID=H3BVV2_TETNG